jgi:hypothetical protein
MFFQDILHTPLTTPSRRLLLLALLAILATLNKLGLRSLDRLALARSMKLAVGREPVRVDYSAASLADLLIVVEGTHAE